MWVLTVPFIIIGLLSLAILLLFLKRWKSSGVLLFLAIGINYYFEWFPIHTCKEIPLDTDNQITLLTYNVKLGEDKDAYKYLDTMDVDLMFIQEPLGLSDTCRLVRHYPYKAGRMILSKFPIRNYHRYTIEEENDRYHLLVDSIKNPGNALQRYPSIYSMDVDFPNGPVHVVGVHLRSNAYSTVRRSMKNDAPWTDGIEAYYENIKYGYLARGVQADMIREELDTLAQDMPTLVVGDFNDVNGSYALERIKGDRLKDAWWTNGTGLGTTYDCWHLKLRLDHILYSKEFEVVDIQVLSDFRHSDHLPLKAVLRGRGK